MNNTKKMPDAYAKSTESNLYKLLQLVNLLQNDARVELKSIDKARDIHNGSGKTLDNYGEMVGESRNGATDEQYRTKILSRIARYMTGSDCNSVISAIAQMFGVEASALSVIEENLTVTIRGITIQMLENSGYKSSEIEKMISGLMPIGVELDSLRYAGTLLITLKYAAYTKGYPILFLAWCDGQEALANGQDIGLSGYGSVPDEFMGLHGSKSTYQLSGTYNGGTLGILSGED